MVVEAIEEAKKRKRKDKFRNRFAKYQQDPYGFMTDVLDEQFTDDVIAVMESVRDNPVTVARSANGTGKTHAAARIALWWYKVYPESQVYTTAAPPLSNLKRLLWGEILSVANKNQALFSTDIITNLNITRDPRSFITGVAIPTSGSAEEREAKFAGKHAPQLLFIVDEGDAVPEEVYRGIESCMSGGLARLLVIFNPRHEAGPVYWMERDKRANIVTLSAFDHPNVISGADMIPGAVDRNITVRRIHEWTRPLGLGEVIDTECFEVPEFLVGATSVAPNGNYYPPLEGGWRKIVEPAFFYMVLGEYPAQSEMQLISDAWIEQARQRYDLYVAQHGESALKAGARLGLDVAEYGVDSNVACIRNGNLVLPPIAFAGVDPIQTGDRAIDICKQYNVTECLVDGTGVGAGVAPYITRTARQLGLRATSVKVSERPASFLKAEIGEFYQMRDQLWWAVREWLRTDPGAMLPPDRMLLEELRVATYAPRSTDRKIKVMDKDTMRDLLKRSPDRADALCLTFAPQYQAKVRRLLQ